MIPRYIAPFDTEHLPSLECDCLVIGSGVAGFSAAHKLSAFSQVLLVTKSDLEASSTACAQGGIACVLDEHDSKEAHLKDTLVSGCGISDYRAVEVMVEEAPDRVRELLENYNANFDTTDGRLDLALEGGHSRPRIVHAKGDATGLEVERALGKALSHNPKVKIMEYTFLVDLLVEDRACFGAIIADRLRKALLVVWSKCVVLASGGSGQLYLVTTNPSVSTGDGVSASFRAGARVSDVEFVQFHPTALHIPEEPKFLISEAMRGEGAFLVDGEGNRIMEGFHPLGELAPRDVVVRRMVEVMKAENVNHLYLDVRHIGAERLKKRFPNIYNHCLEAGIDITKMRIPVSPAAHYMSGGVVTDIWGKTDIEGLYACGEVACTGVHGANRLASNSLLEGLVFAHRLAIRVRESGEINLPTTKRRFSALLESEEPKMKSELLRGNLREVMFDSVGMVRHEKGLREALDFIVDNMDVLRAEYKDIRSMELKNMLILGYLVARAARMRTESRGSHLRKDYPEQDDWNWRKHIDAYYRDEEAVLGTRLLTEKSA
ncbi:MAG: L-aspartate oxidase [Actinomycetota bacterium]|nr:L-aspartate oxidase [Actinomycetota bacterium]